MAKPIFVITVGEHFDTERLRGLGEYAADNMKDWHVLVVKGNDITIPTFQAFYPQDAKDIDIETLKAEIMGKINELTNKQ